MNNEERKAYNKAYRETHKEKLKEYQKAYKSKNRKKTYKSKPLTLHETECINLKNLHYSFQEIGDKLQVTRQRAQQIYRAGIIKLEKFEDEKSKQKELESNNEIITIKNSINYIDKWIQEENKKIQTSKTILKHLTAIQILQSEILMEDTNNE